MATINISVSCDTKAPDPHAERQALAHMIRNAADEIARGSADQGKLKYDSEVVGEWEYTPADRAKVA